MYIGLEGSGKTFLMGQDSERVLYRNRHIYQKQKEEYVKKYRAWFKTRERVLREGKIDIERWTKKYKLPLEPQIRPIVSNITYSPSFHKKAIEFGVPIRYWKDIEELETLSECDLFIDEIGAYFDSRTYSDLPITTRLWLAQAQKLGVDIYGGAQDWGQIDVSYRRLVKYLLELKKFVGTRRPSRTRPAGKHPWAVILEWRVAPLASSDSADLRTLSIIPQIYFAGKKSFGLFDTNARVATSQLPPLKHRERTCLDCGHLRIEHR